MSPGARELPYEKDRDAGRAHFRTENQYFYPQSYRLGRVQAVHMQSKARAVPILPL